MIRVFTPDDAALWDETVRSFARHDVYYLSGYVKGFHLHGDGDPLLFYYEDEKIRGMNVVLRRDVADAPSMQAKLPSNTYYDLATVYGYGGWIIEPKAEQPVSINGLRDEYVGWCREHGIVAEFVRFHPLMQNHVDVDGFYHVIHLGNTVYMDTSSAETVWQNMTSKNRNVIRKATAAGLRTYWCRDPRIIDTFMEIYKATMDKDSATAYYYFKKDYYESVLEDLKEHAMWFYTMLDGEVAAIAIFLFGNGRMHYHLSASRREYQHLAPTNLLLYEAAVWASQNGYQTLHMGGGVGSSHDSLYKFKKAFNRNSDPEYCIGKLVLDEKAYEELVDLRRRHDPNFDETAGFFPLYRS